MRKHRFSPAVVLLLFALTALPFPPTVTAEESGLRCQLRHAVVHLLDTSSPTDDGLTGLSTPVDELLPVLSDWIVLLEYPVGFPETLLPHQYGLGYMTFASGVTDVAGGMRYNAGYVASTVVTPTLRGGKNLSLGIDRAATLVQTAQVEEPYTRAVVMFTDGKVSLTEQTQSIASANAARAAGVQVYGVIGGVLTVGQDVFLNQLFGAGNWGVIDQNGTQTNPVLEKVMGRAECQNGTVALEAAGADCERYSISFRAVYQWARLELTSWWANESGTRIADGPTQLVWVSPGEFKLQELLVPPRPANGEIFWIRAEVRTADGYGIVRTDPLFWTWYCGDFRLQVNSWNSPQPEGATVDVGQLITYTVITTNTHSLGSGYQFRNVLLYGLVPTGTELIPWSIRTDRWPTEPIPYTISNGYVVVWRDLIPEQEVFWLQYTVRVHAQNPPQSEIWHDGYAKAANSVKLYTDPLINPLPYRPYRSYLPVALRNW